MSADRNLLFGILALQLDFISRDQLISGMQAWALAKSKSLADILESAGALAAANRQLLEPLVSRHIEQHQNDPQQSLAALNSIAPELAGCLFSLVDADVNASLAHLGNAPRGIHDATVSAGSPTSALGRFRVLRFHAAGGLGQVSVARDGELNREVALKEIKPEFAAVASARGRFVLEAEITGGLEHPSIVPVYGLGAYADGRPFYAMRFIKGDTLKLAIDRYHDAERAKTTPGSDRSLELRQLLGRFIDVCQAVEYAHSRGVLHRDLKPGNIMLGKYGETIVVDWGLAKASGLPSPAPESHQSELPLEPASGSSLEPTLMGQRIGTLQYMSPEQAAGRVDQLGPATDIFSLGATLYHLLTGQTLYQSTPPDDLIACVSSAEFPLPRTVLRSIPPALEAICLRALAVDPKARYYSAQALLTDIERYLADEPVSAFPEPLAHRARRWARKHPSLVASTLAATIVALVALLAGTFVLGQKNRELAEKEAVATAVKGFLLYDLLEMAAADKQAEAGGRVDPDLKLSEIIRRAEPKIDLKLAEHPAAAAELRMVIRRAAPTGLTIRELLLRASGKVQGRFPGQPLVEESIRATIGMALVSIGQYTAAIPHLERCRELCGKHYESDHPHKLAALSNLARGYRMAGRMTEALPLYEESLQRRKSKFGPEHPETLQAMNSLAVAYFNADRLQEAVPLWEATWKLRHAKLGPEHPDTLKSLHNLAIGYAESGRMTEALPLFEEAAERTEAALGPNHPESVGAISSLAMTYTILGRADEALSLQQKLLQRMQGTLGPDHPDTLNTMGDLGRSYVEFGRSDEGFPLLEERRRLTTIKFGTDHPDTLAAMNDLVGSYNDVGRFTEAIPLLEETLDRARKQFGPDDTRTVTVQGNLANAYGSVGRFEEAEPLYHQVLKVFSAKLGQDHPTTLQWLHNLATSYAGAQRHAEALPLFETALERRTAKLGSDHPDTILTVRALAGTERHLKKWSAAEARLLHGYETSKRLAPPHRHRIQGLLASELIALYTDWEKPTEAAVWTARLAELERQ